MCKVSCVLSLESWHFGKLIKLTATIPADYVKNNLRTAISLPVAGNNCWNLKPYIHWCCLPMSFIAPAWVRALIQLQQSRLKLKLISACKKRSSTFLKIYNDKMRKWKWRREKKNSDSKYTDTDPTATLLQYSNAHFILIGNLWIELISNVWNEIKFYFHSILIQMAIFVGIDAHHNCDQHNSVFFDK